MRILFVLLTISLVGQVHALNKSEAWALYRKYTGSNIGHYFEKGALNATLNADDILKSALRGGNLLNAGEDVSVALDRIILNKFLTRMETKVLDPGQREAAMRNVTFFLASFARSDSNSFAKLLLDGGEDNLVNLLDKVAEFGRDAGSTTRAALMDAIYLGDIFAHGVQRGIFDGFVPSGGYSAHTFMNRLITVDGTSSTIKKTSTGVVRQGSRGVRIGLVGLISNKSAPSALGFRAELDAAYTLKINYGAEIIGLGTYANALRAANSAGKGAAQSSTDVDILCRIGGKTLVVQVKVSTAAHNLGNISDWTYIATAAPILKDGAKICSETATLKERMLNCRYMVNLDGGGLAQAADDLAGQLIKEFEQTEFANKNALAHWIISNNLIIEIQ